MSNDGALLKELADFYAKASAFSKDADLSPIWQMNRAYTINDLIASAEPFAEKLKKIHSGTFYSLIHRADVLNYQTQWWVDVLASAGINVDAMAAHVTEAPIVGSEMKTTMASGRVVSPDLMRRLAHVGYISQKFAMPQGRMRVLELGGGFGALGRVFKMFYPQATYYIVDLPVTLYFSGGFLKSCFPDRKILLVGSEEEYRNADRDSYDYILVPSGLHHIIHGETFDLFMNTHSMGEMPNHVVEQWFDMIQNKLNVKRIFMLNRYLNRVFSEFRRNENKGSVLFDPHWAIKYWEFEPPFMRCPFAETPENQCALVMAERVQPEYRNPAANAQRSDALANYVMQQDWVKTTNSFNPYLNPNRIMIYPERYQDYTMNGTLFKLWESIRLNPTVANTSLMIQYLKYINILGENFEEYYFYLQLHIQCMRAAGR